MNIDDFIPKPKKKEPPKRGKLIPKSKHLTELEKLYLLDKIKKHPGLPFQTGKKFSENSANALTDSIVYWIRLHGGSADRINNMGVYDAKRGMYRRAGTRNGIADIIGTWQGKYLAVEVKYGKDRLSEDQKKRRQEIIDAGGIYIVARSFDQFVEEWTEFAK